MQFYDISIAPGAVRQIQVPGNYIYFMTGSAGGADSTILMRQQTGGDSVPLKPGQAFRLPESGTNWVLSNYAGQSTIIGTILIGDGEFFDNRISGSVEVIDGGKNRTLANAAFIVYGGPLGVAGQYGRTQLWNPVANTKRLVVESSTLLASIVSQVGGFVITNTQLGTVGSTGYSKLAGGAASQAVLCYDTTAASATNLMSSLACPASSVTSIKLSEPIVLPPGWGLTFYSTITNSLLGMTYEWYEEANT